MLKDLTEPRWDPPGPTLGTRQPRTLEPGDDDFTMLEHPDWGSAEMANHQTRSETLIISTINNTSDYIYNPLEICKWLIIYNHHMIMGFFLGDFQGIIYNG